VLYILSVVFIFLAYLSGSIPVGYLVARAYGVDVTASGSGRTGGTNVLRAAGPWAAAFTVAGDMLKGLIPVYLLVSAGFPPLVPALAANAAVLGHNYSIFLKFRGGVGAGTAIGAMVGLSFPIALIAGACGIIGLMTTRYASILSSSIAVGGLIGFTSSALLGYTPYEYIVFGIINVGVIFYALRPNFARIRAGTERKVGQKTENIAKIQPDQESS
jgi:glycerol-3-phosphate acyltransferase PlsY